MAELPKEMLAKRVAYVDHMYDKDEDVADRLHGEWTIKQLLQYSDFPQDEVYTLPVVKTRWRLLTDDRDKYCGGWLFNDDGCCVQEIILKWGEWDYGCTMIEVFIDNEWKQEIA